MLVYGYRVGFESVQGTQYVESYHNKLKAQYLGDILGCLRRLDWLYWVLMVKLALALMRTLVNKAAGEHGTAWRVCVAGCMMLTLFLAGFVRNVRTDAAVRSALDGASLIPDDSVRWVSANQLHIKSSAKKGSGAMLWEVALNGAQSTCHCPPFDKAKICKHVACGLLRSGLTRQQIFRWLVAVCITVSRAVHTDTRLYRSLVAGFNGSSPASVAKMEEFKRCCARLVPLPE
jgi:hypothetical protein